MSPPVRLLKTVRLWETFEYCTVRNRSIKADYFDKECHSSVHNAIFDTLWAETDDYSLQNQYLKFLEK